ncbi:MAG TPA: hypothetical protein VMH02_03665 [Verrucomicrobiae bacterium]|nr:hypothetical protein [Verrucomicrobiae bacterium]
MDKRKWKRAPADQRRECETPGCTTIAKEYCKRADCGQMHCEEHKGSHTAIHTLMKQRGFASTGGRGRRPPR